MAAPSGNSYAVGLRHARVYSLDENGVPAATSTTVYEGLQIVGAKSYELSVPDARRIPHVGDDRILAQDVLPRTEVSTGTLRFASDNHAVYAALTGTLEATIGEASIVGYGTDQQGSEPSLALLCYQQMKVNNVRGYRAYMVPSTQAIVNPNSMNENAAEFEASLLPSASPHHIWGIPLAVLVEGYLEAEILESTTFDIPHIVAWEADGTETEFEFHAYRQAVSTAKIHAVATISPAGVVADVTGTATLATTGVTIAGPLTDGTKIVCFYEYAD